MTVTTESIESNLAMMYDSPGMKPIMTYDNDSLDESISTVQNEFFPSPKVEPSPYHIMAEYYPVAYEIYRIVPFVCYAVGFFGNTISAFAWFHSRLSNRNSSAVFLALLSINDLVFLALHCTAQFNALFDAQFAAHSPFCEVFYFIFLIPQYLTPLLVLGFTTERYVAVCHPLIRRVVCRTRVAISVSVAMAISSVLLSSMQPLLWTYSTEKKYCDLRRSIPGIDLLWFVWSLVVEILMFLLVPVATFVLDILVVRCLWQIHKNPLITVKCRGVVPSCRRSQNERGGAGGAGGIGGRRGGNLANKIGVASVETIDGEVTRKGNEARGEGGKGGEGGKAGVGGRREGGGGGGGSGCVTADGERRGVTGRGGEAERPSLGGIRVPYQATTALLLSISIFEIVTIMSGSVLYLIRPQFRRGPSGLSKKEVLADPIWQRYFSFLAAKFVIQPICMTRHAALIFFYLVLGPRFREVLWDFIRCRKRPTRAELTQSTYAGSSVGSIRSQSQVELMIKH